jgi:hypothetical protein
MEETSTVFGTVHVDRTVVVLLHKHFSSWRGTFFNLLKSSSNFTYDQV